MFQVVVAHSIDPNESEAVQELVNTAKEKLGSTMPLAGILFVSEYLSPEPFLNPILKAFPDLQLIGASTDGEISSVVGWYENSALLALLVADQIEFQTAVCRDLSEGTQQSIDSALQKISGAERIPDLILTFPESLTVGGDAVLQALQNRFGKDVNVFGGLSADQWKFNNTFQIYNDEILKDSAPLLLCYGNISLSYGMASGWEPVGEKGIVTSVERNVIKSINHRSALEFYNEYIGAWPENFGEYPLAMQLGEGIILRAPLLNHGDGSITFAGDIPLGAEVQITSMKRENILKAVQDSCRQAIDNFQGQASFSLITSCTARHYVLGTQTEQEYQLASRIMPSGLPIAGFYSYGEISPNNDGGSVSHLQNETFVCLVMGESK